MTISRTKTGHVSGGGDIKPLTDFALPPPSAIFAVTLFITTSILCFPTFDHPDATVFTNRVFPEYISVPMLLTIRFIFCIICIIGLATSWIYPPLKALPPYRPKSKLARVPLHLTGFKKNWTFTAISWNLLGIGFAVSSYITYRQMMIEKYNSSNSNDNDDTTTNMVEAVDPTLVRIGLILWEITAPMTLLIGAVVKYALWPASIQQHGTGAAFLTPRALLLHNANVFMAVSEVALLGGLPVQFKHISISVLYGCLYILFTWSIQKQWRNGDGPAFIYFFMDTTLGTDHTIALYVLLAALMVFYGVFCGVEELLEVIGHNLLAHAGLAVALCLLVCRFRD